MGFDSERLAQHRRRYAEELRELSALRTEALVSAFARVPREDFLGLGPWKLMFPQETGLAYRDSPDADPVHLYQNALVAIDPERRLLAPLTVAVPGLHAGVGHRLLVTRRAVGYRARFASPVGVFHCQGARTDEQDRALRDADSRGGEADVASLRRDPHGPDATCWLHGTGFCLSRRALAT